MRPSLAAVALALAAGGQMLLSQGSATLAGAVDFFLIVAVYYALTTNQVTGMLVGTACGLLQDALLSAAIGPNAFAKTLNGFLVGRLGMRFELNQPLPQLAALAGATLLQTLTLAALHLVLGLPVDFPPARVLFGRVAVNALLGTGLYALVRWHAGRRK